MIMPSFTRRQIDNSELGADHGTAASHRDTEGYSVVGWGDQLVAVLGLVCTRLTSDTSLTVGGVVSHLTSRSPALLTGYLNTLRP